MPGQVALEATYSRFVTEEAISAITQKTHVVVSARSPEQQAVSRTLLQSEQLQEPLLIEPESIDHKTAIVPPVTDEIPQSAAPHPQRAALTAHFPVSEDSLKHAMASMDSDKTSRSRRTDG